MLTGPYDGYNASEILSAVVFRHVHPPRPEGVDDSMWNLMARCWDYNPRNRPSCEEILRFIVDSEIRDARLPVSSWEAGNPLDIWEAMRATWDFKIDYHRVYDILFHVSNTS